MERNGGELEELHCINICDTSGCVTRCHWDVTSLMIVQPHLWIS